MRRLVTRSLGLIGLGSTGSRAVRTRGRGDQDSKSGRQRDDDGGVTAADIDAEDALAQMLFPSLEQSATSSVAAFADPGKAVQPCMPPVGKPSENLALGVDTVVRGEIPPERRVSDPVPAMDKFDPKEERAWVQSLQTPKTKKSSTPGPLKAAFAAEGPAGLWRRLAAGTGDAAPPEWFASLCRDLYLRTEAETDAGADADEKAGDPTRAEEDSEDGVDPFVWLDIDLLSEDKYVIGPYQFPKSSTYSLDDQYLLCQGEPLDKEYVKFGTAYRFPDRRQLPTSAGTEPVSLYIDPKLRTPMVYIQLSEFFPPTLWLPVKPNATAVRRVLAEFAQMAALHSDAHAEYFEGQLEKAKQYMKAQQMESSNRGAVLRYIAWNARNITFTEAPVNEYPNSQEFFLGEHDDPEKFLEHFDLCPFLFAIPLMRPRTDVNDPAMAPRVDGPGVSTCLYRCVYSKALLLVKVHLSAEVKLPPQDPEAFRFLWKNSQEAPKSRIPVFVRVSWPDNKRMCGGGVVVKRFNKLFGTEFAHDMPVDAVAAIHYSMNWAKELPNLLGIHGMRQRVAELEAATQEPQQPLLYPGSAEIPNPEYTADERLGMHIQYLGALGDPNVRSVIERLRLSGSAPVRMGCAKAAMEIGDRELFRDIVSSEPQGRNQHYMSKLVRRRKKRDITEAVPRLLDEQYELAAPLWSTRGVRIDPNTAEGAVDLSRGK